MPSSRPGIQDVPLTGCRLCVRLVHLLCDCRRDGIEMAGIEERRAVPQLRRVAPALSRMTAPPALQEVDVAVAREVEAVAVAADERICRKAQLKPANRAAQQPMARARSERRHGAAPPARR